MSANELTTPKNHVKPSLENCKVCGITTQINGRAVISNLQGKTNLEKNFQAYCKYGIVFRKGPPVLFQLQLAILWWYSSSSVDVFDKYIKVSVREVCQRSTFGKKNG